MLRRRDIWGSGVPPCLRNFTVFTLFLRTESQDPDLRKALCSTEADLIYYSYNIRNTSLSSQPFPPNHPIGNYSKSRQEVPNQTKKRHKPRQLFYPDLPSFRPKALKPHSQNSTNPKPPSFHPSNSTSRAIR